ncbi:glutamyl-tRNA reductase [Lachnospiraceae bacterium C7]|nr:glutamyl-tRNA reductase [Lachnospiraceae bacterium C7]
MQFGYIGINYKNAPLSIREKVAFTDNSKIDFLQELEKIGVDQSMVLSTCNRSEIFFLFESESDYESVKKTYCQFFNAEDLENYIEKLKGKEAIEYVYRIAAGIESLVLGEDQILGQVKDALDFSRTLGYSKKELNKIIRDSITCAKKIKTELKISEKPVSVGYVGIKKLNEVSPIKDKKVLVIGSGKTAQIALTYIYEYGAKEIYVCNRTIAHARALMKLFPEIKIVDFDDRYDYLNKCDIAVSATSSPHLIIRKEDFIPKKKIVFLDLAAPRDVDQNFANEENSILINIDTLQHIVEENKKERKRLVDESMYMIKDSVEETLEWIFASRVDGTIESLQQRSNEIVEDSFDYLNRKLNLTQRDQKIVKKILKASLKRLIREPIVELKQIDSKEKQDEYNKVLCDLFKF